jgi:hypothetical protein
MSLRITKGAYLNHTYYMYRTLSYYSVEFISICGGSGEGLSAPEAAALLESARVIWP